jgi:hypothetical protein
MSPVHVQFPKMMVCMLQIINLDNVQLFYTHPGEGASWLLWYMVVGSTTICDQVCQLLATGRWFSPGPPASSTNLTDRHDITEILLYIQRSAIIVDYSIFQSKPD